MADVISRTLSDPAVSAIGTAILVAALALWLAAAWWAYSDASRRTDSTLAGLVVAGWIVVSTPLLLPFSLAIYALARPQQSAAEHRTRNLAAELVGLAETTAVSCPTCRAGVDAAWLRCPSCATWLAAPCANCGGWSEPSLGVCPWCGSEERREPVAGDMTETASDRPPRARRQRRRLRPVGPGAARPQPAGRRILAPDGRPLAPVRGR
jgi:hypothetical protein